MTTQADIDALANQAVPAQLLLIDGKWAESSNGGRRDVITPVDGTVLTTIAEATAGDVDVAVASARAAFDDGPWSRRAPADRKRVMLRLADLIDEHALELAVLGARDNGTEISMALRAESGSAASTIRYYAEATDKVYGQIAPTSDDVSAQIRREPLGVIGVIVPWNFPLMIGTWKIGAALATGNSVVVKPPETASLSLLRLGALALEAGLPPGVLNVVTGSGAEAGTALALSHNVDAIAFTGSGATGRRLLEYSAQSNLKRVFLELGGKSPNIVFADAPDLEVAAQAAVKGIFRNSGQVCVAGSRLLVQSDIAGPFTRRVVEIAAELRIGNPLELSSDIGAVHSADQLAKNLAVVSVAADSGADVVYGGAQLYESTGGFYMEPTVVANLHPSAPLVQDEVFGPVLSVLTFDDEPEATRLANDTVHGLAAAVWTSNLSIAHRMTRNVAAGTVYVNTYGGAAISTPMAGMKQSGNGVDKSLHALDNYSNLKTVWIQT